MFLSEAEAEARLADLRRRRDDLDRLIADHLLYLELGRRLPAAASDTGPTLWPVAGGNPAASGRPRDGEAEPAGGRERGRALIAAVIAILAEARQPLHARDILERLTAQGFTLPGADPVAALNTRLWKRSGPGGPFRRLGDAVYAVEGTAAPDGAH